MAQFLRSLRTEKAELDRYPGRAAMLSLKRFGSFLSRYNCMGMSAKNCAKQITPTDRVSASFGHGSLISSCVIFLKVFKVSIIVNFFLRLIDLLEITIDSECRSVNIIFRI